MLFFACNTKTQEKWENYDFGVKKFDEPFYYLPSKPSFLVKSLQYTPSWFLTDTIYLTKTIEIEFNEESVRSGSKAVIMLGDSLGNIIEGIQVYYNSVLAKNNQIELNASSEDKQDLVIGLKLLPEFGKQKFKGGFFLLSEDIDEFNDVPIIYDLNQFADWSAEQKIGRTWMLWLVWLLIALIVICVLCICFYLLVKIMSAFRIRIIDSYNTRKYSSKTIRKKKRLRERKEKNQELDPNRSYRREEIDFVFKKVKEEMHRKAKKKETGKTLFIDCYTNKRIQGGEAYDYEHIRSAEFIFMKYRDRLTNEQIAKVVNCEENVKVTLRVINQSKGKYAFEEWCTREQIIKYGIDFKYAINNVALADKGILRAVKKYI